ncbi:RHS repeat-associated core domain-containing protein [Vibrio sagamiensis]|uniref:RHS repeat-associated core domain-containing protein n=1 Tax=Vibrio sagamiensis NBRC 104589 TaxID=1219064 RepID=A0A511QI44_9VIBR|nr:RHS repeat-associated core domain-containing protein [Vibrio sagamiensis]PNQ63305.1 RHS repeat-associated core domain-containing protein [Vibrio agarivorans]GEM76978.1 hypothetical protein VSA01S_30900 [Vibrio sagamiensis NBRC 104589]
MDKIKETLLQRGAISRREFLNRVGALTVSGSILSSLPFNALSSECLYSLTKAGRQALLAILQFDDVGFNGELKDPGSGGYLLGNGYRAYRPELQRFMASDSMSPFGKGGFNSYTYCSGDPANFRDPTGHFEIADFLIGLASLLTGAAGVLAAPFTGGTSIGIGAAVIGGALGATSGALTVADSFIDNESTSKKLGYAAMALAALSTVSGVAGAMGTGFRSSKVASGKDYVTKYKVVRNNATRKTIAQQEDAEVDKIFRFGVTNLNDYLEDLNSRLYASTVTKKPIPKKTFKNLPHSKSSTPTWLVKVTNSETKIGGSNKFYGMLRGMGGGIVGQSGSFSSAAFTTIGKVIKASSKPDETPPEESIRQTVFAQLSQ